MFRSVPVCYDVLWLVKHFGLGSAEMRYVKLSSAMLGISSYVPLCFDMTS